MSTGYCIIRLCPLEPSHTCRLLPELYGPFCSQGRNWTWLEQRVIQNIIYARTRQTPHGGCDVLLFIWSHSCDASMLHVQGQKNSVQVQRRACRRRDVFVKNNHVRKNLIVAASAKYTPTLCDSIYSALALPDRSHFSSHYEVWSAGEGRNLNVTIAESIWKLSIELRFCGVKWLFKTSIRFLIRAEWDLISKLILVNDFLGCQRLLCLNPIF